ncbi:hypothetical protein BS78_09G091800 [Paspalum vaginatum]|nr:hypothetical protein BS78_09G091800 [Paspalum vaginatum]
MEPGVEKRPARPLASLSQDCRVMRCGAMADLAGKARLGVLRRRCSFKRWPGRCDDFLLCVLSSLRFALLQQQVAAIIHPWLCSPSLARSRHPIRASVQAWLNIESLAHSSI